MKLVKNLTSTAVQQNAAKAATPLFVINTNRPTSSRIKGFQLILITA